MGDQIEARAGRTGAAFAGEDVVDGCGFVVLEDEARSPPNLSEGKGHDPHVEARQKLVQRHHGRYLPRHRLPCQSLGCRSFLTHIANINPNRPRLGAYRTSHLRN